MGSDIDDSGLHVSLHQNSTFISDDFNDMVLEEGNNNSSNKPDYSKLQPYAAMIQ